MFTALQVRVSSINDDVLPIRASKTQVRSVLTYIIVISSLVHRIYYIIIPYVVIVKF